MAFVRRAIEDHKKEGCEGKFNLDFIDSYLVEKETKDQNSTMYGEEGGTLRFIRSFIEKNPCPCVADRNEPLSTSTHFNCYICSEDGR